MFRIKKTIRSNYIYKNTRLIEQEYTSMKKIQHPWKDNDEYLKNGEKKVFFYKAYEQIFIFCH